MYLNVKLQLWKSGMRQNRLAKLLAIDETALSRIVNGYREPSAAQRLSIANLLGCDPDWLFRQEDTHAESPGFGDTKSPAEA